MHDFSILAPLKNEYLILRHGESEANVAQLITSDPARCISNYGLTEYGREQVAATIQQAKRAGWLSTETIIYCSDFRRTVETAELACSQLHAGKIHETSALRERFFGAYDGKNVSAYVELWPQDPHDERLQRSNGVEGPEEISVRLLGFIKNLETEYWDKRLLLVSHGDPLQVLQAAFAGLGSEQSRALPYIAPAEIRKLTLLSKNTPTN